MKALTHILLVCFTATALCACSGGNDSPVPRRTAFPRIAVYDSVFAPVEDMPVNLLLNRAVVSSAKSRADGTRWITAKYPNYKASVYITLTPVSQATVEGVVDNRLERIHLNIGSQRPSFIESRNHDGYLNNIVVAPSVFTTPLQFISVKADDPRWVVSGAVCLDDAATVTSVDSITPVYDAIMRDLKVALDSLRDL